MGMAAAPWVLPRVGEALLSSGLGADQPLGWQEGSKKGGKLLLVLDFRKDLTLLEALI